MPGEIRLVVEKEHLMRYVFASRFVKGKTVLDAGCGTRAQKIDMRVSS